MKKQFLNLGKALNKAEQKSINGGGACNVTTERECIGLGAVWTSFMPPPYGPEQMGECCIYQI